MMEQTTINNTRRIIPSIYVSDSQNIQGSDKRIIDYGEGLELAIQFAADGADEIIFMDLTPPTERRRNVPRFLKDINNNLNIPFVFGGGVNTVNDVEDLLKNGARRVYVNSAAVRNPGLINQVNGKFGSNSLLVAIDTRKTFGKWKVFLNGGKSRTEIDLVNWVMMSKLRGAGEILISAIKRSNETMEEIHDLYREVLKLTQAPVLASIGVNSIEDFIGIFSIEGINGIVTSHYFSAGNKKISEVKNYLGALL